jgi:hypothetical protein
MIKRISFALVLTALVILTGLPRANRAQAQFPGVFGAQRAPSIDVDRSGKLYLLMSAATKTAEAHTPGSQVFFTMSKDGGLSWDNTPLTRNLSNSKGEAFGPSVSVTKGSARPYVVYHDNVGGITHVYMLRTKKKAKFKKPVNITPHDGGAFTPKVSVDVDDGVNVVWGDTSGGGRQVAFLRSTDEAITFTSPKIISGSSLNAFDPEIATASLTEGSSGFAIYVVWDDKVAGEGVIMFSRSTDGGETFSDPTMVSRGPGAATESHLAADSQGRIHVVWAGASDGDTQAFYSRSTDGGDTFSEPMNLSSIRGAEVHKPVVAAFEDRIFVAFNEDVRTKQVFLVTSENGGRSFGEIVQVSNADPAKGRGHSPAIVVDPDGRIHICWIDNSILGSDEGLLYYTSSSNGLKFSSKKLIYALLPN